MANRDTQVFISFPLPLHPSFALQKAPDVWMVWGMNGHSAPSDTHFPFLTPPPATQVGSALVVMVRGMNDVAHLSEGEVERMLERESLALNLAILSNRRAYADLVQRLQVRGGGGACRPGAKVT